MPAVSSQPDEQQITNILCHGGPEPAPRRLALRAGLLELDLVEGQMRHICLQGQEVIRRIYFAARDSAWRTAPSTITIIRQEVLEKAFIIQFQATSSLDELQLEWQANLVGRDDSSLTFHIEVLVCSDCYVNRVGLCTLYPAEYAGKRCTVAHSDGTLEQGQFPELIAPHQPFTDIRKITYSVQPGVSVEAEFTGDVFEMEDQRNWSDASFKVYSGQLSPNKPLPLHLQAGTRISQQVSLALKLKGQQLRTRSVPSTKLTVAYPCQPLPAIGLGIPIHSSIPLSEALPRLTSLNLQHLRLDIQVGEEIRDLLRERLASPIALELALHCEQANTLTREWLSELLATRPNLARILLVGIPPQDQAAICTLLHELAPGVPVGAGSDDNPAELTRGHPDLEAVDFISCALNPQVHLRDDDNLVENLGSHSAVAATMHAIAGDKPVVISPITLQPRLLSVVGAPKRAPQADEMALVTDPRQVSLLGASWLAVALANLSIAGVSSITMYDVWGWRGIIELPSEPVLSRQWPFLKSAYFPAYHVLRWLSGRQRCQVLGIKSNHPLQVGCLAVETEGEIRAVLGNLTSTVQPLSFKLPATECNLTLLDAGNAQQALTVESVDALGRVPLKSNQEPYELELSPFGLAFINARLA